MDLQVTKNTIEDTLNMTDNNNPEISSNTPESLSKGNFNKSILRFLKINLYGLTTGEQ